MIRSKRVLFVGATIGVLIAIVLVLVLLLRDTGSGVQTLEGDLTGQGTSLNGTSFAADLRWKAEGGAFARGKDATTATAPGPGPAFATIDPKDPPSAVTANFAHVGPGSGLVFNYVNPQNYWSVVAVYEYGTWNINKTVNGQTTFVANTGSNLSPTDTSIELRQANGDVTVSVDRRPSMRVRAPAPPHARVGLLASAHDNGQTRWNGLSITS